MKKRLRLYLDSSIVGWSLNESSPARFMEANELLRQISEGKYIGVYSWVLEAEVEAAPAHIAADLRAKIEGARLNRVPTDLKDEADRIAQLYCQKGIVPQSFSADALHIAIASLWKADALVSYNFHHIVKLEVMVAVNEVNRSKGLKEIFLCQPQEVIAGDESE